VNKVLGVAAIAAIATASSAQMAFAKNDFAIGLGVGTSGAELQGSYRLSQKFSLRGGVNVFKFDYDETFDDVAYSGELDFGSVDALVDFRPFSNWLTITGGAVIGNREAKLSARPTVNTQIGDVVFTPAQIGQLDATIGLGDFAPYVGLGLDTTFSGNGPGFGFRASVGGAFGEPEARVIATGGTAPRPASLDAELANEARKINDDADALKIYPVLSVGLTYRF